MLHVSYPLCDISRVHTVRLRSIHGNTIMRHLSLAATVNPTMKKRKRGHILSPSRSAGRKVSRLVKIVHVAHNSGATCQIAWPSAACKFRTPCDAGRACIAFVPTGGREAPSTLMRT